jgi:hypothetical protein
MKHPFASNKAIELNKEQTKLVSGGAFIHCSANQDACDPHDGKARAPQSGIIRPIKPPVYYTQAIGEDGGNFPDPYL